MRFSARSPKIDQLDIPEIRIDFRQAEEGVDQTIRNLEGAGKAIAYTVARALAFIAVDLLAKAQPRVPVETGELRESGRAQLKVSGYVLNVAEGNKDGTVNANTIKVSPDRAYSAKVMDAQVHYHKVVSSPKFPNFDVALFTHESIDHYGGGKPSARTPGTGPKYLEGPYLENRDKYVKIIEDAVKVKSLKNIRKISSSIRSRRGKYTVDLIKLNPNKLK